MLNTGEIQAMLKITINPKVLNALRAAFPLPANSAEKALTKYVEILEAQVFRALHSNRTPADRKLGLYVMALTEFSQKGPYIGGAGKKTRLHAWLKANNLELVQPVVIGSNLTGALSRVKLSKLVQLDDLPDDLDLLLPAAQTTSEIDEVLTGGSEENAKLFDFLYPDYYSYTSDKKRFEVFDVLPVNTKSLRHYIVWLATASKKIAPKQKETYLRQAKTILGIALHTNGILFQRKKQSAFGRMYYNGISVQTVNKEMRRAILGDAWMYDVRSAVITWKMTFASELLALSNVNADYRKVFSCTLLYLEDRRDFMATVIRDTFDTTTKVPSELMVPMIKQAITAIGFGAGLKSKGWKNVDGTWSVPSMADIFKNKDERDRFIRSPLIQGFFQEQSSLDTYLYSNALAMKPKLFAKEMFKAEKRTSKAKVIAYLYQQSETHVMNLIRGFLVANDRKLLANIHDAVVVRKKLSFDLKHEIELQVREHTGNNFWALAESKLHKYNDPLEI